MSGYIDAGITIERINQIFPKRTDSDYQKGIAVGMSMAKVAITEQPTAEVEPVVHCQNCKYWAETEITDITTIETRIQPFCMKHGMDIYDKYFCADGKKVTES